MRYFIGFLITIGLIVLLIVLLFGGGGGKSKVPSTTKMLSSYANTDAVVRMTIDGPVNSNQEHQQVQITVGRDDATFQLLKGYDGSAANTQNFANTDNSYQAFLHSLAVAGFTNGKTDSNLRDERGYCSEGDRYIFELIQDGKELQRFWSTSCGSPKSYLGNTELTIGLFQAQIPRYNDLAQDFQL